MSNILYNLEINLCTQFLPPCKNWGSTRLPHLITAHNRFAAFGGSGLTILLSKIWICSKDNLSSTVCSWLFDHIFWWSSFNRKDSHQTWSLVCARLADSDLQKTSVMRKRYVAYVCLLLGSPIVGEHWLNYIDNRN